MAAPNVASAGTTTVEGTVADRGGANIAAVATVAGSVMVSNVGSTGRVAGSVGSPNPMGARGSPGEG